MRAKKVEGPVGDMIKATLGLAEAELLVKAISDDVSESIHSIKATLTAAIAGPVEAVEHRAPKL